MSTKKKITKKNATSPASAKQLKKTTAVIKKVAKKAVKKKTTNTTVKKAATKVATKKVAKKAPTKKKTTRAVTKKSPANTQDGLIHGIEPYKIKAREKYMNPAQVAHFRDILVAWKTDLLSEVSRTIHLMKDENINHPDPNDRASQETDMSLELRNRDRERKLLKKIDATIARVDNNEYGWCDRCGVDIGIRRLEARPTAELCVDCKTLREIKERQMI